MPAEPRPTQRRIEIAANIVPDAPDRRDLFWEPAADSGRAPKRVEPDQYRRLVDVTWHQRGEECTGFALAAIANFNIRRHRDDPDLPSVSRRMLYESAQLHDDRDFEEGSTLRGALRGWRRTGVALDELWPYDPDDEHGDKHGTLTMARLLDARQRPLISYRRIMHADIDLMRHALAEGHVLFAAALIHLGWYRLFLPEAPSRIERRPDDADKGGHAFVIVGYDDEGFWVHNSWGPEWGTEGYALLPYDEWIADGHDTWVVDLDPETLGDPGGDDASRRREPTAEEITAYRDLWPHLVVLRDDGALVADGLYEMDEGSFGVMTFLFGERTADWKRRRVVVVTDDGYLPTPETIGRYRELRDRYMAAEIYPIFVVWETSWGAELSDELDGWIRHHARRDGAGEPPYGLADPLVQSAVRASVVRPMWQQLVERSRRALDGGGAHTLAAALVRKRSSMDFDLHVVASGVGDLLQRELLAELPSPVATATVIGSASPLDDALSTYGGALRSGDLDELLLINGDGGAETARFGPVAGTLLDVIAGLLAPAGTDDPVTVLGQLDDAGLFTEVTERGRVIHRTLDAGAVNEHDVEGDGSRDAGFDIALAGHDAAIAAMNAWEPATAPTAPAPNAPNVEVDLPLDPLARAVAAPSAPGDVEVDLPLDPLARAVAALNPLDPLARAVAALSAPGDVEVDLPLDPLARAVAQQHQRR